MRSWRPAMGWRASRRSRHRRIFAAIGFYGNRAAVQCQMRGKSSLCSLRTTTMHMLSTSGSYVLSRLCPCSTASGAGAARQTCHELRRNPRRLWRSLLDLWGETPFRVLILNVKAWILARFLAVGIIRIEFSFYHDEASRLRREGDLPQLHSASHLPHGLI